MADESRIETPDTVRRAIADLLPAEYNPRTEDAPGLHESLAGFGLVQPLVVNTFPGRENRIVGGEKRWRELMREGITEAPVIEVSLPLEREKELNIRLNRNQAEWDWGKLDEFFAGADLVDWGFEPGEIGHGDFALTPVPAAGSGAGGERDLNHRSDKSYVRPVIRVDDLVTVERALSATGLASRSEALVAICKRYLDV